MWSSICNYLWALPGQQHFNLITTCFNFCNSKFNSKSTKSWRLLLNLTFAMPKLLIQQANDVCKLQCIDGLTRRLKLDPSSLYRSRQAQMNTNSHCQPGLVRSAAAEPVVDHGAQGLAAVGQAGHGEGLDCPCCCSFLLLGRVSGFE